MKKPAFVAILLFFTINSFAQFNLSGKINHYTGTAALKVNIPVIFGYFEQNSISVPVSKNGDFNISLPNKGQRFAYLNYQGSIHTLLMTPNKSLVIELDQNNKIIRHISGSALAENSLIEQIRLDEPAFFLLNDTYSRLNGTALINQVLKPYDATRNKKIDVINHSKINSADKKLLTAEINYLSYNNLYELTDIGAENSAVINKFVAQVYSRLDVRPIIMPAGPQYYLFANNYLRYQEQITQGGNLNSLSSRWQTALKHLPTPVLEQFGYQLIMRAFFDDDKTQVKALSLAYLKNFPSGMYARDVRKKSASVK